MIRPQAAAVPPAQHATTMRRVSVAGPKAVPHKGKTVVDAGKRNLQRGCFPGARARRDCAWRASTYFSTHTKASHAR